MEHPVPTSDLSGTDEPPRPGWHRRVPVVDQIWRALRENPSSLVGLGILCALILLAIFAPLVAPYNPNATVGAPFEAPSGHHWLGLDDGGHDVLSLLIWGLRLSLIVGFGATAVSIAIGAAVGLVAGFFGGLTDSVLMRFTDFALVVPTLPLMIVVADVWGSSLAHLILVIGLISWTMTAIVIRAQTRTVCKRVYVRRAVALGAKSRDVIVHHVLPQLVPLIVANAVLLVGYAIFTETALAFLGLGDPTQVSLGTMIEFGFLRSAVSFGAWWAIVPPGALVALIVVSTSLVGRAIEDGLNPRIKVAYLSSRHFRVLREEERAAQRSGEPPRQLSGEGASAQRPPSDTTRAGVTARRGPAAAGPADGHLPDGVVQRAAASETLIARKS